LKKDLDAALSQVQQEDFKKVKAEIEDLQKDISELKGGYGLPQFSLPRSSLSDKRPN
jgi:hypothetical protein